MKKQEIYIICGAVAALMLGILFSIHAISAASSGQPPNKEIGAMGVPTCIPGEIFSGDYLRIGINDAGSLGVTNNAIKPCFTGDPGVGFQSVNSTPFMFPSTESAAIWFWGEGYKIAYKERERTGLKDTVAWYQPNEGFPPAANITNIIPVSHRVIINDKQKAVKQVAVRTLDKKLMLTFTFTFLKSYPSLDLDTTVTNIGSVPLRDVVYTRYWDIDVCTRTGSNNWTSTDHAAYAWDACDALSPWFHGNTTDNTAQLTFSGSPVSLVDLYAWDDYSVRSPGVVVQSFSPIVFDGHAGLYYMIGDLKPRESRTVHTVYQSNFPKIKSDPEAGSAVDAPPVEDTSDTT